MVEIIRCKYCAGDWDTHDVAQRRYCNIRLNRVAKIAASIKAAMESDTPNVAAPVPWKRKVETVRQYDTVNIED
jgi:hypothetical protein